MSINYETYVYEGKEYLEAVAHTRDATGKQHARKTRFSEGRKRITCKRKAIEIANRLLKELEKGIGQAAGYSWERWQNLALERMRLHYKESTVELYVGFLNRWIDPAWKERDMGSFQGQDVHDFIHDYLECKGATAWTKKNALKRVHRVFQMAIEEGIISRNPSAGIKVDCPASEGKVLTPGEVEILLTKGRQLNHPYYPHWVLALLTGMRNGELYALRWSDIDLETNLIHVNKQFTSKDGVHLPKKGRTRKVDISPDLKAYLLELKGREGRFEETLWDWENRRLGTKRTFVWDDLVLPRIRSWRTGQQAMELKDFCRLVGITPVEFHDLRATHITNLLENGTPISKVMKQVGHRKMQTTDGYHRLSGVDVKGVSSNLSYAVPRPEQKPDNVIPLFGGVSHE